MGNTNKKESGKGGKDIKERREEETKEEETTEEEDKALWEACSKNNIDAARELLNKGAKTSFVQNGHTALHEAIRHKNSELILLLLDYGSDPNAKTTDLHETAFHTALRLEILEANPELMLKFIQKGAKINEYKETDIRESNFIDIFKETPLHIAVEFLLVESVKLLLEHGAQVDAKRLSKGLSDSGTKTDTEETALHVVCCNRPVETEENKEKIIRIAKLLIAHGADINARRIFLRNIEIEDIVEVINLTDPMYVFSYKTLPCSQTALHIAIEQQFPELVWLLVSHNTHLGIPYLENGEATTVWELAEKVKNKSVTAALFQNWKLEFYIFFPKELQLAVKSFMIIVKRENLKLDKHILQKIVTLVAFNW